MVQSNLNSHIIPVLDGDTEAGYGQLFAVIIRRFPWFLIAFLGSATAAAIITFKTHPTYRSSMQLLVESNYQGKKEAGGLGSQFTDSDVEIDTATQLKLMQSTGLIQKAVEKLTVAYPTITVTDIQHSLLLEQLKNKEDNIATKIFQVTYTDIDPKKTQKVLTAIRQVYVEYNKQQQNMRLEKGLQIIRQQLRSASDDVNVAEANLERFRRSQNLIDPESQAKQIETDLNTVQNDREKTRSEYQEALAREKSLESELKRTPQNALVSSRLSQSSRYQSLLNEIQKTELSLAQERLRFTDNNPEIQNLLAQLQSQKELLQEAVTQTLGGESSTFTTGKTLLEQGQLSQIDLNLASQLVDTQTNIVALVAHDQVLTKKETALSHDLKRYPYLLAYYSRILPQVQFSRERLQELLKAEQQLSQELSKGGFNWQVVEEPLLGDRLGPNLQQNLLLGAVVGLMLGGIAAFLRESVDDAVHTTAELEKQSALPLLGTTPRLPSAKPRESVIKLPFGKPDQLTPWTIQVLQSPPRWESLDLIFKNIELLNTVSGLKSLMVTSALPDDCKSALALGLAMSAARLHKKVLLIDANLRNPSLHQQLNLPNDQGLSTLLANDITLPNQIGIPYHGSTFIDILTAGPMPDDPPNLLSSPRMAQLMSAFEDNYDLVLVDAPSVLGLVDALLTASACHGVVMIASIGRVTKNQLSQATAMLSRLNLIGVVANGVSSSDSAYVPYIQPQQRALQQVEK